jgi:hypothetical protein
MYNGIFLKEEKWGNPTPRLKELRDMDKKTARGQSTRAVYLFPHSSGK